MSAPIPDEARRLPEAVRNAMARAIERELVSSATERWDLAADAAIAALLGACEVREEWGIRDQHGEELFSYWAEESGVDLVLAQDNEPTDRKIRRLVITTEPEEVRP